MTIILTILAIVTPVFMAIAIAIFNGDEGPAILTPIILLVIGCGIYYYGKEPDTPSAYSLKLKADHKPRVVAEFDDCKVWAFTNEDHRWVHVAKCEKSLSTESTYKSGKSVITERVETK